MKAVITSLIVIVLIFLGVNGYIQYSVYSSFAHRAKDEVESLKNIDLNVKWASFAYEEGRISPKILAFQDISLLAPNGIKIHAGKI